MIRYRDGKIVSTKGERFTQVTKAESDEMKKSYVNIPNYDYDGYIWQRLEDCNISINSFKLTTINTEKYVAVHSKALIEIVLFMALLLWRMGIITDECTCANSIKVLLGKHETFKSSSQIDFCKINGKSNYWVVTYLLPIAIKGKGLWQIIKLSLVISSFKNHVSKTQKTLC